MKKADLRLRVYNIVAQAVEDGVAYGARRADKHACDPLTDDQRARVIEAVETAVLNELCEVVNFD